MRLALSTIGITIAVTLFAALARVDSSVEAGTARRMTVSTMVDSADLVVQGEVLDERSRIGARGLIETVYRLRVSRTFWGEPAAEHSIVLPGGVLEDGRGMLLAGMPRIDAEEEVLLFLTRPSASGVRMPIGLAQGKFSVVRRLDGAVRLVRDQAGLRLANPATGELEPAPARGVFDYATVVAEIHAAAAARRARALERPEGGDDPALED